MPLFSEFSINFPEKLETQVASLNESMDIIQQDRLFTDSSFVKSTAAREAGAITSVYGKALKLAQSRTELDHHQAIQEIADSYKDLSNLDAKQINSLRLVIDTNEIRINNFAQLVLDHHNRIYAEKPKINPTMDMVADYLQDEYKLKISTKQRNFLRTQWNQMNIAGLSVLLQNLKPANEQFSSFIFKDKKLVATKFTTVIEQKADGKSGNLTLTADLKALQGGASEQNPPLIPENWIPHNRAQISINYKSNNGLTLEISEDVIKSLRGNFAEKSLEVNYLDKAKKAVRGLSLRTTSQNQYNKLHSSTSKIRKRSV